MSKNEFWLRNHWFVVIENGKVEVRKQTEPIYCEHPRQRGCKSPEQSQREEGRSRTRPDGMRSAVATGPLEPEAKCLWAPGPPAELRRRFTSRPITTCPLTAVPDLLTLKLVFPSPSSHFFVAHLPLPQGGLPRPEAAFSDLYSPGLITSQTFAG